jgi:hypothetical protein
MGIMLFANNAYSALDGAISNSATTVNLTTGTGSRFPAISGGNYFYATLVGTDSNGVENAWEVVKVTARVADALTVVRAQDGTAAAAWPSGARIEMRAVRAIFDGLAQEIDGTLTNPTVTNFTETTSAPAAGSTFTVDLANGTKHVFTTNANATINLPAPAAGKEFQVNVKYGGAHSLTWTVTGGSTLKWAGGTPPTPTSVNGKQDVFVFEQDGTETIGYIKGQNI